jgi:hypothetical protein
MTKLSHQTVGIAIVIVAALIAVFALTIAHLDIPVGVGIAVVGLLIGTGVARGKFSSVPDSTKRN